MLLIMPMHPKLKVGRLRCVAITVSDGPPAVDRLPSIVLIIPNTWPAHSCMYPTRGRVHMCATQTLETALLDGPSLLLVVEKENGASRLAMLLQGGASGMRTPRRMGGGATQSGALAAAASSKAAPLIFASTTAKVNRRKLALNADWIAPTLQYLTNMLLWYIDLSASLGS